ncbi:3D domain-containing protein [Miniphocaeibacter massiliensis]|uniref:3D domain-containing protein n=1 Tax=Miniphocaeibacter massiliensis TaxID=2041841 RepID=UPI0024145233|nr:3D domain-containing protein [Miniphocaeibacter massiliensis]
MNFKKLMVSGLAVGAITASSINLSYADTKVDLPKIEGEDSTVAVDQIENNKVEYIGSQEQIILSLAGGIIIAENEGLTIVSDIQGYTENLIGSLTIGEETPVRSAEVIGTTEESTEATEETTEAKEEPTEATEETTEAKEESTEATEETTEAKEEPTEVKEKKSETLTRWTTDSLNVRQSSKTESKSLGVLAKGTKVTGTLENNWLKIEYNGKTGYVYSSYLSAKEVAKAPAKKPAQEESKQENNQNNDKDFAYSKVLTVKATAYSMNEPGLSHKTASGIDLRKNPNVIAVDRRVIPLGTKVYVEGYGYAIAGDTGGAIKGNKIDVHFNSVDRCYQWGVKNNVKVYILK